jgi:uncharacterized protein (DUF433 family)
LREIDEMNIKAHVLIRNLEDALKKEQQSREFRKVSSSDIDAFLNCTIRGKNVSLKHHINIWYSLVKKLKM